jgi:uridine phosphorylase
MYREGIEVKRDTNAGILLEYPSCLEVVEKLFPDSCERIYYPNDEDSVVHVNREGIDVAFIAGHGASIAACMAERLRVYGAQALVRIGTCGALSKTVRLWEPIITTACFSDEGTSRHYLPEGFPIVSNPALNLALREHFEKSGITPQEGISITTDGRWREDPGLFKKLHELGVVSVEMETAAILAVAQYRKLFGAAINIATDLPADVESEHDFKGIPDRENYDENFDKSLRIIIPIVIDTLVAFQRVVLASHL